MAQVVVLAGHTQVAGGAHRGPLLRQVTLLDPCQDPVMHLAIDPADAAVTQGYRLREGAFLDVFVDGRPGKTGRIDDFFQADDPHERGSSYSFRGLAMPVKKH